MSTDGVGEALGAFLLARRNQEVVRMLVAAFNTPRDPSWRWRIVSYAGDTVAESHERFPSIRTAVAQGAKQLTAMNLVDRSQPMNGRRSTSDLRARPR